MVPTLVFSAKLSTAAPAFAPLVVAMMFLSFSVLVTNYLFGTGSRWIVLLLAGGSGLAVVLIDRGPRPDGGHGAGRPGRPGGAGPGHGRRLRGHPPPAPRPALGPPPDGVGWPRPSAGDPADRGPPVRVTDPVGIGAGTLTRDRWQAADQERVGEIRA